MSEIRDVYSRITGKIIADLEQGIRPWHRPWNADHAAGRIERDAAERYSEPSLFTVLERVRPATESGAVRGFALRFNPRPD